MIGHISTDSIYITLALGIIYYSACTPNLDVVKVTQSCWVGIGAESVKVFTHHQCQVHITSSALHEGQFGL